MQEIQRIPLEGAVNTRDLGGFKTMDGRTIVPNRLIRSGRLAGLTHRDRRMLLNTYNVRTIVDFRMQEEQEEAPDPDMENVTFITHSILDVRMMDALHSQGTVVFRNHASFFDALQSQQIDKTSFFNAYYKRLILSPHAIDRYRCFFDILLKQQSGAVLWHCSAGKDRTGIATILLLSALGVSKEDIRHDYLFTNVFLEPGIRRRLMERGTEITPLSLRAVAEDYFITTMDTICGNYDNMANYLETQIGLTKDKITRLGQLYLR